MNTHTGEDRLDRVERILAEMAAAHAKYQAESDERAAKVKAESDERLARIEKTNQDNHSLFTQLLDHHLHLNDSLDALTRKVAQITEEFRDAIAHERERIDATIGNMETIRVSQAAIEARVARLDGERA